jgi:hypothetical protein
VLLRLLPLAGPPGELAEAEVAVSGEWAQAQRLGQGQGLAIVRLRLLATANGSILGPFGDVIQCEQVRAEAKERGLKPSSCWSSLPRWLAKGPRVGRPGTRPPTPPIGHATKPKRKGNKNGGGRDFPPGQNSHTGEVHRRGSDAIPRSGGTLMLRCLFYDHRERIYRALGGPELDTFPGALAFMRDYLDRTEGRPMK